jgi:hypothetical protein
VVAVTATSRQPRQFISYLQKKHLSNLVHWLQDWKIAINVSKSTTVLLIETTRSEERQLRDWAH